MIANTDDTDTLASNLVTRWEKQERPDIIQISLLCSVAGVDSMCCCDRYCFPHLRVRVFPNVACDDGFLMIEHLSINCSGGPATTLSNI